MDKIHTGILILHTVVALVIIALVLLQRGKGADAGAAFGSGASGTVFGSRGNTSFFSRMTAILVAVFFATSLGLAYLAGQPEASSESLIEKALAEPKVEKAAPAVDDEGLPKLPVEGEVEGDPAMATDELPALPDQPAESDALEDAPQE